MLTYGKPLNLNQIAQINVRAQDLDRAIDFYQDKLGMKFLFRAPSGLAFFDCNGTRLLLDRPEDKTFDHPSSIIYFKVADIHQAYQALVERGVKIEEEPHKIAEVGNQEVWMAFFRDSEDNVMSITAEIPKK